jgi:tetratricopeptide (TPR) repeat protein/predicted Ser/Thr protein kinase
VVSPDAGTLNGSRSSPDTEATRADVVIETEGADALVRGDEVGRYIVLAKIGRGGMGIVYSAYDPELDRRVALKVLAKTGEDKGRVRMLREAQAIARISHPNVIPVHDVGHVDGRVFIAMEFIEGHTLTQWLESQRRDWTAVLDVYLRAGEGLAAAHAQGLVHRDFKPDNVMIGDDGRVRVLDFGLARTDDRDLDDHGGAIEAGRTGPVAIPEGIEPSMTPLESNLTVAGTVLGTPAYMAPEQHLGEATDPRTDEFAFCVALYEGLYGQRPYAGNNAAAIAFQVLEGEVRSAPPETRVPTWVRKILLRGLSRDIESRYPTISQLLEALREDPTGRRRRSRVWLAGFGVAAVAGVAAAQVAAPAPPEPCARVTSEVDGVWSSVAKARLRAAFSEVEAAEAKEAEREVFAGLSDYANTVSTTRRRACEQTYVHRAQSDTTYDLQIECLDRATHALDAAVGVIAESDANTIIESPRVISALPDVNRCDDLDALRSLLEPPTGPEAEAQVAVVRDELARGMLIAAAGRHAEALEVLDGALANAKATAYEPVVVEARRRHARLVAMNGKFSESVDEYLDGYYSARQIGHDEQAAAIANDLVFVLDVLGERERALEWSRLGEADSLRIGFEVGVVTAIMYRAMVHNKLGHHQRSLDLYDEAKTKMEAIGDDYKDQLAILINNRAIVLMALERWDEAAADFEEVLARTQKQLGNDHPQVGLPHLNLANIAIARRQPALALEHITEIERVWNDAYPEIHNRTSMIRQMRASALRQLGRAEEALASAQSGLDILTQVVGAGNHQLADPMIQVAELQTDLGQPEQALELLDRARAFADPDEDPDDTTRAGEVGARVEALLALKRPDDALKTARERADQVAKLEGAAPRLRAQAHLLVAEVLHRTGRPVAERDEASGQARALCRADDAQCGELGEDIETFINDPDAAVKQWLAG